MWSSVCVSKMSGSSLSPLKLNCAPNNRPRWRWLGTGRWAGKIVYIQITSPLHSSRRAGTRGGDGTFAKFHSDWRRPLLALSQLQRHYNKWAQGSLLTEQPAVLTFRDKCPNFMSTNHVWEIIIIKSLNHVVS